MHTNALKLKNDMSNAERAVRQWLRASTQILALLALLIAVLQGSAVAAEFQESQMGEALMQMDQGDMASSTPPPTASEGWRTCDVIRVGPGWGNVYLRLVCNGVSERWFIARKDQERDMLAAGLTAISLEKKVSVYLAHMPSGYHEIRACYVVK